MVQQMIKTSDELTDGFILYSDPRLLTVRKQTEGPIWRHVTVTQLVLSFEM